jgi:hypothetical protein
MPVAAMVVMAVAATASAVQQRKASKQQRRASQTERRMAEVQNVRSRRESIRERILQTEALRNQAAVTGTMESSGFQGGVASLGSQTASNIGFQTQLVELNNQRLSFLDKSARAVNHAGTAQAVGSIASMWAPGGAFAGAGGSGGAGGNMGGLGNQAKADW